MDTLNNIKNLFKYYVGLKTEEKKSETTYNKKPDAYKNINSSSIKSFK